MTSQVDWFTMAFTVLGGLGLFFLGMRQLSDSLQSVGGVVLRRAIDWLTTNRVVAVLVGVCVTTIVQSSSITTVMVVSMANAGLMNLTQAIGVIFGANVGTTITGWILAIQVGKFGLAFIGLSAIPALFLRDGKIKVVAKVFFALGLVFYGLMLMSNGFVPLRTHEGFLNLLTHFSADTIISVMGCIFIGTLLTAIIQSSSAMLGITIALASTGVISFQTAAALILGENIGTTITAYLASVGGNTNAKRAARAHILFNLCGATIAVASFRFLVPFVDWLIPGDPNLLNAAGNKPLITVHISAFHTIFNLTMTLLFLPFLPVFARLVEKLVPDTDRKQRNRLIFLSPSSEGSTELSIQEAYMQLRKMANLVKKALLWTRDYVLEDSDSVNSELTERIRKYETITDRVQKEVSTFLSRVIEAPLTKEQTREVYKLLRINDELESIADYCRSIIKYRARIVEERYELDPESALELRNYVDSILQLFNEVIDAALFTEHIKNRSEVAALLDAINAQAEQIRKRHLAIVKAGSHSPLSALSFSDMIVALRRIKNHTAGIVEAILNMDVFEFRMAEKANQPASTAAPIPPTPLTPGQ